MKLLISRPESWHSQYIRQSLEQLWRRHSGALHDIAGPAAEQLKLEGSPLIGNYSQGAASKLQAILNESMNHNIYGKDRDSNFAQRNLPRSSNACIFSIMQDSLALNCLIVPNRTLVPSTKLRLMPCLFTTTVRMLPPEEPSRAIARLTACTTNARQSASDMFGRHLLSQKL